MSPNMLKVMGFGAKSEQKNIFHGTFMCQTLPALQVLQDETVHGQAKVTRAFWEKTKNRHMFTKKKS